VVRTGELRNSVHRVDASQDALYQVRVQAHTLLLSRRQGGCLAPYPIRHPYPPEIQHVPGAS